MGIIDVKEIEIDYQIPKDYEQFWEKESFLQIGNKPVLHNKPSFSSLQFIRPFPGPNLSAPGSKTVMFYKSNWDVSAQWETTFKLATTSFVCGRPYRNDCFSYKKWAAYCGDVKVKGMD